jgi:ferredoxin
MGVALMHKHGVVFFSPAGSTRLIAEALEHHLRLRGCAPFLVDLSRGRQASLEAMQAMIGAPCCIWMGSPVYCDHAVPLVHDFIEALPMASPESYAIPFVTWGGVTSGLALPEMGRHLLTKHYRPLAAAKILAVHSSMWCAGHPLGQGHPDGADLGQIAILVNKVCDALEQNACTPLDLETLNYLSPSLRAQASIKSLAAARAAMSPLAVDDRACQQCGLCAGSCPVAAIELNPFPVISQGECVLCLQCVRTCPHQAFPFNCDQVAARIIAMAANSDEEKNTRVFYS